MERYFSMGRDIRLVMALIDYRHLPSKDDMVMIDFLIENEFPFVIVLTKSDKLSKKQREEMLPKIIDALELESDDGVIEFSSETGEGCDKIREIFENIV